MTMATTVSKIILSNRLHKLPVLCALFVIFISLAIATPDSQKPKTDSGKSEEDVEAYLDISYFDHRNHSSIMTRITGMFGLNSKRVAVDAELVHVRSTYGDHDGCDYIDDWNIPAHGPWIALAVRGECSFEHKISNLYKKYNASAVIVYNNVHEPLFIVNHSPMPLVTVLISKKDGEYIGDLFDHGIKVNMIIAGEKILASRKAADQASMQMRSAHEYRRSRAVMAVSILVILGVCVGFVVLLISTIRTVISSSRHKVKKMKVQQRDDNKKTWPVLSEA